MNDDIEEGQMELYTLTTSDKTNVVIRHRMSREIALEVLEEHGDFSYLWVVEKLNNSANAGMWRDVLTWIDELKGEKK